MTRAIDLIIQRIATDLPDVSVRQLKCVHPADDDGLWFFTHKHTGYEVQLESSTGEFPFLAEFADSSERVHIWNMDNAIRVLKHAFRA